jgi:hypothetical protein
MDVSSGVLTHTPGGYSPVGDLIDWAGDLQSLDPALGSFYWSCRSDTDLARVRYPHAVAATRARANEALKLETAFPAFDQPLIASANIYAFRRQAGVDLVTYVYFTSSELVGNRQAHGTRYAFDIGYGAGDTGSERVVRTDTTLVFELPDALPENAVVGAAIPIAVPRATEERVSITIRNRNDAAQGQVIGSSKSIPDMWSSPLSLSDLVIADDRQGTMMLGDARLAPMAGHQVTEGAAFRLYYEIYGAGDVTLRTTIQVVPDLEDIGILDRVKNLVNSREAVSLTFDDRVDAVDGTVHSLRTIDAELNPGAYFLVVTVMDPATGHTATRQTHLGITAAK